MEIKIDNKRVLKGSHMNFRVEESAISKDGKESVKTSHFANIKQVSSFLLKSDMIDSDQRIMLQDLPELLEKLTDRLEYAINKNGVIK